MLSNFIKIVKKNESNIILTLNIVFIALIVSGLFILSDNFGDKKEIIFENPSGSIFENSKSFSQEKTKGIFVGSVNSNKYHWPNCPFAKRIAEENKIWFSSEQEAQNADYIRCGSFEKYRP